MSAASITSASPRSTAPSIISPGSSRSRTVSSALAPTAIEGSNTKGQDDGQAERKGGAGHGRCERDRAATVAALAAEGADVGIVDRNAAGAAKAAEETAKLGVRSLAATADVGDPAEMKAAFGAITAALGDIDILFNNAGIDTISHLDDMPIEMWDEMMRVNLRSVFIGTQLVLPAMRRKKWGRIINTASQLGHKGAPQMVHYCAAKAGVIGFTRRSPTRWHATASR